MALLNRLKGRVETDLTDLELQTMIDETMAEIEARFGVIGEITILLDGRRKFLVVHRPINDGLTVTVVEISVAFAGGVANETTLSADDYRIRDGGRTIERLLDGTNGATSWAPVVRLTYTPTSDQPQRDETVIRIVQIDIAARGVSAEKAGDYSATYHDATKERERLINRLAPLSRMMMA